MRYQIYRDNMLICKVPTALEAVRAKAMLNSKFKSEHKLVINTVCDTLEFK